MLGRVQASAFINLPYLKRNKIWQAIPAQTQHVFFWSKGRHNAQLVILLLRWDTLFFQEELVSCQKLTLPLGYTAGWQTQFTIFFLWHFNIIITFLFKQLIPQIQSMIWLLALQWHLGEIRSKQLSIFFPVSKWFLKGHHDIIKKLKAQVISIQYAAFHTQCFYSAALVILLSGEVLIWKERHSRGLSAWGWNLI